MPEVPLEQTGDGLVPKGDGWFGQWDLVHCPPWAEHVIVAAGDTPFVVLAVGARPEGFGRQAEIVYPPNETAAAHGASVEVETTSPREAYVEYERPSSGRYRDGDLPG